MVARRCVSITCRGSRPGGEECEKHLDRYLVPSGGSQVLWPRYPIPQRRDPELGDPIDGSPFDIVPAVLHQTVTFQTLQGRVDLADIDGHRITGGCLQIELELIAMTGTVGEQRVILL